jgi:triosephosphate isomerase
LDKDIEDKIEIVLAPSYTSLRSLQTVISTDNLKISLSSQDVSIYDEGAYTGEVSAFQLKKLNIDYAIVGHSERRIHFNETDSHINVKIHKLLDNDIIPILCFGESLEDRSQGSYLDYIKNQVNEGLKGIRKDKVSKLVLAYEPIWSIGTGEVASIEDIVEVLDCVKNLLLEKQYYSEEDIKFIYGGSVSSDNSTDILNTKIIDGALVGGASLDADKFVDIIKSVNL